MRQPHGRTRLRWLCGRAEFELGRFRDLAHACGPRVWTLRTVPPGRRMCEVFFQILVLCWCCVSLLGVGMLQGIPYSAPKHFGTLGSI